MLGKSILLRQNYTPPNAPAPALMDGAHCLAAADSVEPGGRQGLGKADAGQGSGFILLRLSP